MFTLRGYQHEAHEATHNAFARGLHRPGIQLPTGTGKHHPLNTEVPTPEGLRLWGDLNIGDYVFGSDGQPTMVTGIFDRGTLPNYRVTMKHGESVLAGADHLWQVQRKGRLPRVVSTEWLMSQPIKDRDGYLWAIPVTKPVVRPWVTLPLDPYVVGSLIANGNLTSKYNTYLTTPDKQVWDRVAQYVHITDQTCEGYCPRVQLHGVLHATHNLGMRVYSRDKRIPRIYLESSIFQRVALLQGLMVADGSVRQGGRRSLTYSTTSPGLVDDMIELVTSLGGTCSASKYDRSGEGKPIEYSLRILLPLDLTAFDTDRKIALTEPTKKFKPRSAIISIEPAGNDEVRCITVDAPNHLYLITRSHIVTHNTRLMAYGAEIVWRDGERVNVYLHRDTLVDQTARTLALAGIPEEEIGIVKANKHQIDRRCLVVSIHSLRNKERLQTLPKPKLNIIDEAHVSVSNTYRNLYDYLGNDAYFAGYTATWVRSDDAKLGDFWEEIVFSRSIQWAINKGYLVEPKTYQLGGNLDIDLSQIRTTSEGDYNDHDSEAVVMVEEVRDAVVKGYLREPWRNRSAVLFAPTQVSARYFGEALKAAGVPVAEIFASTSKAERTFAFHAFNTGAIKVLVTCTALAEGWDCPRCEVAMLVRPTKHVGLFCFDSKTELLTPSGWVLGNTVKQGDLVSAFDSKTGTVQWEIVQNTVNRKLLPDERMMELSSPSIDFRVTDTHRIIWKENNSDTYNISHAGNLAARSQAWKLPVAGVTEFSGVPLSDAELAFIGWVQTDGCINKDTNGISITQLPGEQSDHIEKILIDCGFKWRNHPRPVGEITNYGVRRQGLNVYTISKGMPRGTDKHLRGWGDLYPYLPKAGDIKAWSRLSQMTEHQLTIFLDAWHRANGAKQAGQYWTRQSYHITTPQKDAVDWLQAMCMQRGWRANIATQVSRSGKLLYILHCKKSVDRWVGGTSNTDRPRLQSSQIIPDERVWCVTVSSGAVITRRNGKGSILGNCQQVGRVLRPWAGKTYAYILDFVGVTDNATLAAAIDLSKTEGDKEDKSISSDNLEECEHCNKWRVLKFCEQVELFLCFKCIKELGIEPDEKTYNAKRINGIHEIDLFADSKAQWLTTYYGQPFLATSNKSRSGVGRIFFVAPIDDGWNAGYTGSMRTLEGGGWLAEGVTATEAVDIATMAAMEEDPNIVHKKAAWRRGAPTEGQLNFARRNGINPEGMTKSQLADAINVNIASQTLGRVYAQMYEAMSQGTLLSV